MQRGQIDLAPDVFVDSFFFAEITTVVYFDGSHFMERRSLPRPVHLNIVKTLDNLTWMMLATSLVCVALVLYLCAKAFSHKVRMHSSI